MRARVSGWKRWAAVGAAVAITVGAGGIAVAVAGPGGGSGSSIVPVVPVRILDTRNGTGGASAPIGADTSHKLTVAGVAGVPGDATGVLLNVTVVNGTAASFLTVYPDGSPRPNTSNLNWTDGAAHPNLVSVALGANGAIDLYNNAGQVDLVVDLDGYFTAPTPVVAAPTKSALSAEAIVESGHDWPAGPFPFNTTDLVVGTDITHDAVATPESFGIVHAGVYRVDYHVSSEGCCAFDGTFGVTVNGTPVNPTSAIGESGPGGGGDIGHSVLVDVPTDNTVLQLVLTTSGSLRSAFTPGGDHSMASITIERIGDHS